MCFGCYDYTFGLLCIDIVVSGKCVNIRFLAQHSVASYMQL